MSLLNVVFACSGLIVFGVAAQASPGRRESSQASSPFPLLSDTVELNSLDVEGKPPFYLKLAFQIFDMGGKPSEEGSLEGWWARDGGSYLQVSTPSLGTLHRLDPGAFSDAQARRSIYLLSELLDAFRAPYGAVPESGKLITFSKTDANVALHCVCVAPPNAQPGQVFRAACMDGTNAIRIVSDESEITVRNQTGKFGSTVVASNVEIYVAGHQAIRGTIAALQTFDPSQTTVKLEKPQAHSTELTLPSKGVIAGEAIRKADPIYPRVAQRNRITGEVLLRVVISPLGRVVNVTPIASRDPDLTEAAVSAAKQWTFQPSLLDGKPVQLDARVFVRFGLGAN